MDVEVATQLERVFDAKKSVFEQKIIVTLASLSTISLRPRIPIGPSFGVRRQKGCQAGKFLDCPSYLSSTSLMPSFRPCQSEPQISSSPT